MTIQGVGRVSHSTTGKIQINWREDLQVAIKFETNVIYPHLAEVEVTHENFHHRFTTEVRQLDRGRYSGAASRNTTVTPSPGGQVCIQAHTDRLRVAVIAPVNEVSLFVALAEANCNRPI